MSLLPRLGLRARLLLLAVFPAAVILATVLGLNFLRMRTLLLTFGEEILRDRVRSIAADLDRDTAEAVTTLAAALPDRSRREYETGAADTGFKQRLNAALLAVGCGCLCIEWILRRLARLA